MEDARTRIPQILSLLKKEYPRAQCALHFRNPLEMLISTILSAQCTDKRVNQVTHLLFKKYRSVCDYAHADPKEFEQDIRSTGFYRNKAKNIMGACKILVERYSGKVPRTMGQLLELPGVARKTANIVLSNSYGVIAGIPVDTHMRRVNYRLGLTKNTDPNKIEKDLMNLLPQKEWFEYSSIIIEHGRKICKAPTPFCSKCPLEKICPKKGVIKHR